MLTLWDEGCNTITFCKASTSKSTLSLGKINNYIKKLCKGEKLQVMLAVM